MNRILKWIGIVIGGLIGLIVIAALGMFVIGRNRLNNAPEVALKPVNVASGDAAHGEHLYQHVSACAGCHIENQEGEIFIEDGTVGVVTAPNLTSSHLTEYSDEDWERAIRHGIGGDGRTLIAMPSVHYQHISDSDLADMIAYLKSVPAVESDYGLRQLAFPGNIIFGNMAWGTLPVNNIDHENVGGAVVVGVSAEYGEYLSQIGACRECHGPDLMGPTDPNVPQGPALSGAATWSQDEFITAIRTGVTPAGVTMSEEMPWDEYSGMTDDELTAFWMYLATLSE